MPFGWLYSSRKITEFGFGKHFSCFFLCETKRHLEKTNARLLCTSSSILKSVNRCLETAKSSWKEKDTWESSLSHVKIPTTPSADDSDDIPVVATPPPDLDLQITSSSRSRATRERSSPPRWSLGTWSLKELKERRCGDCANCNREHCRECDSCTQSRGECCLRRVSSMLVRRFVFLEYLTDGSHFLSLLRTAYFRCAAT
jgi:hypothetical protein